MCSFFLFDFQPEYKMADPICTFLFSILVLGTTFTIMRDIIIILMEGETLLAEPELQSINIKGAVLCLLSLSPSICGSGTPAGVKYIEVRHGLLAVKGVTAVHNLHIWALTMNQVMLSAHVAIGEKITLKWKHFHVNCCVLMPRYLCDVTFCVYVMDVHLSPCGYVSRSGLMVSLGVWEVRGHAHSAVVRFPPWIILQCDVKSNQMKTSSQT